MNKKVSVIAVLAVLLAASLGVVNATVFHIGTLTGNVKVVGNTGLTVEDAAKLGGACAGFYVYGTGSGDTIKKSGVLPTAGTNANNTISENGGDSLGVSTYLHGIACEWSNDASSYNTTYSAATVNLNVTVGHWYVQDFIGFGYPNIANTQGPSSIYVTFNVTSALDLTVDSATLKIYKSGSLVGTIDLTSSGSHVTIQLGKGEGLQFDLDLVTSANTGTGHFTVTSYVASNNEAPRGP